MERVFQPQSISFLPDVTNRREHQFYFHEDFVSDKQVNSGRDILIQENERTRLGQELHDSVNPFLAVAKLYIEQLHAQSEKECFAKKQSINAILLAIETIRNISSTMAIAQKMDRSLYDLMDEFLTQIQGADLFDIEFAIKGKKEICALSDEYKITLYRILQEQLNNTIKYSKASLVKVVLSASKNHVCLSIEDNGVGFVCNRKKNGIGLKNIENRVAGLKGNVEIKSRPGEGCMLTITLPIN